MPSDATPSPLTVAEVDRITSVAAEGYGAGSEAVGRLAADWRRLTAENAALRRALPDPDWLDRVESVLRADGHKHHALGVFDLAAAVRDIGSCAECRMYGQHKLGCSRREGGQARMGMTLDGER